jgi:phosphatidate cytidylyltransferase
MVRLSSGVVLILAVVASVWLLPSWILVFIVGGILVLALVEYGRLARALGAQIPLAVAGAGALAACVAAGLGTPLDAPLLATVIVVGGVVVASRGPAPGALGDVGAALLPTLYLGLPLGSLVALHAGWGREAVLLLLLNVVLSDTAQYYGGRLLGRRPLSPLISPKKTMEGAVAGLLVTPPIVMLIGRTWLPSIGSGRLLLVSLALVGLGIVGDLFESLLKRSAGVKDSSALIPGHGGILDRIDSLLFAAPGFYLFLRYAA